MAAEGNRTALIRILGRKVTEQGKSNRPRTVAVLVDGLVQLGGGLDGLRTSATAIGFVRVLAHYRMNDSDRTPFQTAQNESAKMISVDDD